MNFPDKHLKMQSAGLSLMILFILVLSPTAYAKKNSHPLKDIQSTAEEYVRENLSSNDRDATEIRSKLDPRLKLPSCTESLQAFFPEYGRRVGNVTVGIKCNGQKAWSIFVPVSVKIYRDIAIANRPLNRGTLISENDIRLERRNVSVFSSDYFTDKEALIGKELVHSIQMGRSLASHNLKSPTAIKRGSLVTLLAKNDVIEVRMEGKALSDGHIGERIKVRNLRSQRIIEGVIKSSKIIYVQ